MAIASVEDDGGVLRHNWYPAPADVAKGDGDGTIVVAAATGSGVNTADACAGQVPPNPMKTAVKPAMGGGLFCVPELVDAGGVQGTFGVQRMLKRWALDVYLNTAGHNHHSIEFPNGDRVTEAEKVAGVLSKEAILSTVVKDGISRKASEWKRAFSKRVLDLFFREYFQKTKEQRERLSDVSEAINLTLGGSAVNLKWQGDEKNPYAQWVEGRGDATFVFGAWRRSSVAELQLTFDEHMHVISSVARADFNSSEEDGAPEWKRSSRRMKVEADEWSAMDVPTPLAEREGGDLLFKNSHAARCMPLLLGRVSTNSREFISGRSSVLSIARADAWLAACLTVSQTSSARSAGGMVNAKYNEIFSMLLPHALRSLLLELRVAVTELTTPLEFRKPFDPSEAQNLLEAARSHQTAASEGTPGSSQSGLASNSSPCLSAGQRATMIAILDTTSPVPYATHRGNSYCNSFRAGTVSFIDHEKGEDYLVVTPEFFKANICGWMGDVCDAYIGQSKPYETFYNEIQYTESTNQGSLSPENSVLDLAS